MKPAVFKRAAACATSIALVLSLCFAPAALAANDSCPTRWDSSCGASSFYYGEIQQEISGAVGLCVDVSKWQGSIDWAAVKAAGIDYAIIRCGFGQDEPGQDDPYWLANVSGALENGVKIGVYLYSYAYSERRAVGEAEHTLRLLKDAGLTPDKLVLPVFIDLENQANISGSNTMTARIATAWCNTVAAAGYEVGIYANQGWWSSYLTDPVFSSSGWSTWVAQWNSACDSCTTAAGEPAPMEEYGDYLDLWQFTCNASVPGIASEADLSLVFTSEFPTPKKDVLLPGGEQVTYDVDDAKNTATAFIESRARTATIPESVHINGKDYTVTAVTIASSSARSTLRSVTLPKTISALDNGAFANCTKLKSVTLGTATTEISAKAFKGCSVLKSVTVPAKVKSIGSCAFYKSGVKTLTVKSTKLTKAGVKDCLKGSNVTTVKVPKSKLKAYKGLFTKNVCGKTVKVVAA